MRIFFASNRFRFAIDNFSFHFLSFNVTNVNYSRINCNWIYMCFGIARYDDSKPKSQKLKLFILFFSLKTFMRVVWTIVIHQIFLNFLLFLFSKKKHFRTFSRELNSANNKLILILVLCHARINGRYMFFEFRGIFRCFNGCRSLIPLRAGQEVDVLDRVIALAVKYDERSEVLFTRFHFTEFFEKKGSLWFIYYSGDVYLGGRGVTTPEGQEVLCAEFRRNY